MEHLLDNITFLQDKILLRGYVFGVIQDIRPATLGIFLGGLTPLVLIPFLEKYVVKSKHHIVVGDHDDVKKDLDHHH